MRKSKEVNRKQPQLDLFGLFEQSTCSCDGLLDRLIQQGRNVRYLIYKIQFSDTELDYKNYWAIELDSLLEKYSVLCESISRYSGKHYNKKPKYFYSFWAHNEFVNMTYCPELSDILSHYKNCLNRLKAAILSESPCLRNSGLIIDQLLGTIVSHQTILNSYNDIS